MDINEPYANDAENAIALPMWMKWMRALVIGLLCVSILAMAAVGFAAFRLVMSATTSISDPLESLYVPANLPEGGKLISLAPFNGGSVLVYSLGGELIARHYSADGTLQNERVLE